MIVLQLIGMLWAFALPGVLVVLQLEVDWSPWIRVLVGVALGGLTVPMIAFCVAWLLGTRVSPEVTLGVGTALNLGAGVIWWLRRRR